MDQARQILGVLLAGGILWSGGANATSVCDLDLLTFNFTNTGVCGQVSTTFDGVVVGDIDESATTATATAQQGVNPPAAGSNGTSGIGTATFPNPDGTGGSVGAAASVSGGGNVAGEISSVAGAFHIGEFIADDGLPGSNPFDLGVNLAIKGELFAENASASMLLAFAAVDGSGVVLDQFVGIADLRNTGPLSLLVVGFTDPNAFTAPSCSQAACTANVDTIESFILADLVDGDVFGLFLTIGVIAALPDGEVGNAYSNFANTVEISFSGANVTALPANVAVPEPSSVALMLIGVLAAGSRWRRRSV